MGFYVGGISFSRTVKLHNDKGAKAQRVLLLCPQIGFEEAKGLKVMMQMLSNSLYD